MCLDWNLQCYHRAALWFVELCPVIVILCVHVYVFVRACVHGWCPYCILGCAALTRPNEAETVPWVTSLLSAAPFLQTLIWLGVCVYVCVLVRPLVMQEFWWGSHFTKSDSHTIMLGVTITLKSGVSPVAIISHQFLVWLSPPIFNSEQTENWWIIVRYTGCIGQGQFMQTVLKA